MQRILTAVLALALTMMPERVDARDTRASDGPALGLALGADAGGIGGFASYYLRFDGSRFGVMPHAGLGYVGVSGVGPGWSVGVGGSFGRSHRLVLDLNLSTVGAQELTLYDTTIDAKAIYGLGLTAGWEWLSKSGFFMRANIGPVFAFLPPLYRRSEGWSVTGNLLSLGVKLW